jgi:hypothetical protein
VGAFLIFNTFSIIVAQRTRELALLRCLGASRRQVLGSVLLESGLVGLIASAIGLGLGVLIALGLRAALAAIGIDLPATGTVFEIRTVIVSMVVGVVITLVSSFMPALRATRVPPVAAWRRPPRRPRRRPARLAVRQSFPAAGQPGAVTSSRYGGWRLNGQPQTLQAVDPVAYDSMVRTETTSGRLADLRNGGLAVSEDVARQHGWKLGSIVPMEFPTNGVQELPVKAVFKDNELNGGYLLSLADYQKGYGTQLDSMVIAKVNPGVPAATAGVLAAILPGRRAARVDVLRAITTE